jgi:hypothetical protein
VTIDHAGWMPARVPRPPPFDAHPFRIDEALRAGIGEGRLRGPDLARPFHGVRSRHNATTPLSTIEAYAPLLRSGDRFSHTTAAILWGAPLPPSAETTLHITASLGHGVPRSRGVVGHESVSARGAWRHGFPCSDAVSTFLELANVLQLDDLVAVGDHLVLNPRELDPADPRPFVSLPELRRRVEGGSGRGVRRARSAVALLRDGVESRPESLLRLLLVRAGLPEPLCGAPVRDTDGRRIGWFDLSWPEFRTIAEYDGDQHRTSTRQYERDITRFDRAADAGQRVIRVRSHGLFTAPEATVECVRSALIRGGWH